VLSAQRLTEFREEVSGWVGAEMLNATAVSVETVAASFVVDAFAVQGVFGQVTPAVNPSHGLTKMQVAELSASMGLRRRSVESTEGLVTLVRHRATGFAYQRAPWSRGRTCIAGRSDDVWVDRQVRGWQPTHGTTSGQRRR